MLDLVPRGRWLFHCCWSLIYVAISGMLGPLKCLQVVGNSAYGGATFLIVRWCQFLLEKGCQVDVVASERRTVDCLRLAGARVIDSVIIPREVDAARNVVAFAKLYRLIKSERYQVVHTYTAVPGVLGRLVGRVANVPVILHHQAAWSVSESTSSILRLAYGVCEGVALLACTKAICVGSSVEEEGRNLWFVPRGRLTTIPNGIDASPYLRDLSGAERASLRRSLGLSGDDVLIGNTGRLAVQKDNLTLIRALPIIRREFSGGSVVLLFAGVGEDRARLQEAAEAQGCASGVRFLGFREDIPAFLNLLDVFASLSWREGLSISILEAMAAARPIVASSIPPNAELIEHEVTGLLVQPRREDRAAAAILQLLRDPELGRSLGRRARETVLERYTIARMLEATWQLYLSGLERRSPGSQRR